MILGIGQESAVFLYAGLAGVSILLGYYVLICFRKLVRHSALAAGIEDLVFWLAASVYIFRRMYETTFGSIRWFFLLGLLAGAGMGWTGIKLGLKLSTGIKKKLDRH